MSAPSQKSQIADNTGVLISSTNPLPVEIPLSGNKFFTQGTTGSTAFSPAYAFGFSSKNVIIINDGTDDISFSFDGASLHGILQSGDKLTMDDLSATQVYFKSATLGETFRVFAW